MADPRALALVVALLGQVGMAAAGLLPLVVLPLCSGLLVAACALERRADDPQLRLAARLVTLLLGAALVLAVSSQSDRQLMAVLLALTQAANAVVWRTHAERLVGLLLASAALLVIGSVVGPLLADVVLAVGSVALLAAVVLHLDRRREQQASVVAGVRRRPPVLRLTSAAAAAWVLAALLVPGDLPGANSTDRGSSRAGALVDDVVDLRARGSLSDRPLAAVRTPDQLWRSGDYSTWDGSTWTNPPDAASSRPAPAVSTGLSPFDAAASRVDLVELLGGTGLVWSPGLAVEVVVAPSARRTAADGSGAVQLARASSYVVRSVPLEQDPARLRQAAPGPADPRWLQLPDTLPERVRGLARSITADAPTTYDKVVAVERWLETHARYRLDSPVPRRGEDAVDRFLFVDQVGFCSQFAAAETVLLRAVGIPARFVVGLAYPEPAGDGTYVLREKNQHAWVEVSYDGIGWSPSDPTAGAPRAPSARSATRVAWERIRDLAPYVLPPVLLLGAWVLLRELRRRRREGSAAADPLSGSAAVPEGAALRAYLRWNATLGPAGRRADESLREQRRRLDLAPSHERAVEVVERECYALRPPGPAETAAAVAVLDPPHTTG